MGYCPITPIVGRTLTSAWIETGVGMVSDILGGVALSRVRGLKLLLEDEALLRGQSHSHECVD